MREALETLVLRSYSYYEAFYSTEDFYVEEKESGYIIGCRCLSFVRDEVTVFISKEDVNDICKVVLKLDEFDEKLSEKGL